MNIIHANVSGDNIGWGSIPRRGQTATRPRCIRNQQLCVHYVLCTLSTAQCSVCAQCAAHQRLWSLGCGNELWIVSSAILSCAFCKINSLMCAHAMHGVQITSVTEKYLSSTWGNVAQALLFNVKTGYEKNFVPLYLHHKWFHSIISYFIILF